MSVQSIYDTLNGYSLGDFGALTVFTILRAALTLAVCAVAIRLLTALIRKALVRTKLDKGISGFIAQAARISMWVIAALITADGLGIPSGSLLAVLGAFGLALSLAVQGLASNLFSGVSTLMSKPFSVGDFAELAGVTGTVTSIGLLRTKILTADNRRVYIPNTDVAGSKIINYAQEPKRRVDIKFFTSVTADSAAVKKAVLELMNGDSRVLAEPKPFAGLEELKENAAQYVLRAWAKSENYWDVYFALCETLIPALTSAGVAMPDNRYRIIDNR
jgi:small conductance mechanosensitive channel